MGSAESTDAAGDWAVASARAALAVMATATATMADGTNPHLMTSLAALNFAQHITPREWVR